MRFMPDDNYCMVCGIILAEARENGEDYSKTHRLALNICSPNCQTIFYQMSPQYKLLKIVERMENKIHSILKGLIEWLPKKTEKPL